MPRKLRQLQADLRRAGAYEHATVGDHTRWKHDLVPGTLIEMSGGSGDDAKLYQERDLRRALARIAIAERAQRDKED